MACRHGPVVGSTVESSVSVHTGGTRQTHGGWGEQGGQRMGGIALLIYEMFRIMIVALFCIIRGRACDSDHSHSSFNVTVGKQNDNVACYKINVNTAKCKNSRGICCTTSRSQSISALTFWLKAANAAKCISGVNLGLRNWSSYHTKNTKIQITQLPIAVPQYICEGSFQILDPLIPNAAQP